MHRLLKTSKSGRLKMTINFGSCIIKDEDKKKMVKKVSNIK